VCRWVVAGHGPARRRSKSSKADALSRIAADPKHLGADIGVTAVLHTWDSNLDHHSHVHCIVPGGGISPNGAHWVACRRNFFLSVRVLSRLFRRLFLDGLAKLHAAGSLRFFNGHAPQDHLAPSRRAEWVVYAKRPFAGPEQALAYLARHTHRVAIGNSRLEKDFAVLFGFKSQIDLRKKATTLGTPSPSHCRSGCGSQDGVIRVMICV
jgi:hypothetical protein